MVLRGDGDFPGAEILDRLIPSTVTEFQLEGGAAEGMGEQLIPKADAEDRDLADELSQFFVDVTESRWISRAV